MFLKIEDEMWETCARRAIAAHSTFLSCRFVVIVPWFLSPKRTSDTTSQFKTQPSFGPDGVLARDTLVVAGLAKGINDLKCVEPQPPGAPKTIKDPTLTKKEPDCPLNPPLKVSFVVGKMELGCESVKISGGEILQVEVERKFGKSTAYSVGLGVSASTPGISLGGGGDLGDNGKSWTPPGSTASASVGAQLSVTVRVNDSGAVEDVFVKSTVQASGSAGPLSGAIGITGTISLEDGAASVTPILKGSAGSK